MQAKQVLHKILKKSGAHLHKTRRAALEAVVLSALFGRRLTVTDLGRSIQSDTSQKHNIKRADRLLSNPWLHAEGYDIYRQLCHQIMGSKRRPIIFVDWSDMDDRKQHFVLRAALAMNGRSYTVYEEVHTLATKEKSKTHRRFLAQLKRLLPPHCQPILVTDAGFRTTWFKLVEEFGWDWVGRIRNRHDIRWKQGGPWFDAKKCYTKATYHPTYLGEGFLTRRHQHPCRFIIVKSKSKGRHDINCFGDVAKNSSSMKNSQGQKEPWLLATSLPKSFAFAKNVVKYYKGRMQIEESFRDVKSHRFGLSLNYHYTHSVKRLQVLLLIATLAFRVLWLIGIAAIQTKKHFQFQANSIRHKTILSVIFIGLQVIKDARIKFTSVEILEAWRHFCGLQLHHELE